jgi:hypothetical protein
MAKLFDARDDLDWCELTDAEHREECFERATQAMAPFLGRPVTYEAAAAIERTLNRVRTVIELEQAGMRRDWAEALADGN